MKRSSNLRLALMATALPAALTACDNPAITGEQHANADWEEARMAPPAVDCSTAELMQTEACKLQLEHVLANSPRYGSQQECEQNLGGDCAQVNQNGNGAWIGPMTGFVGGMLLMRALDDVGDAFERKRRYNPGYRGTYRTGSYPGTTGRGSYPTTGAPPPPPARAVTQSRSGFGSTASARRSFGG